MVFKKLQGMSIATLVAVLILQGACYAKDITLISSDGKSFKVDKDIAEYSQTIKEMLNDTNSDQIPLSNIDSRALQIIIDIAKKEKILIEEALKKIQQGLEFSKVLISDVPTDPKLLMVLLNAANYLNYPSLLNALARKVAEILPPNWPADVPKDLYPIIAQYIDYNNPIKLNNMLRILRRKISRYLQNIII